MTLLCSATHPPPRSTLFPYTTLFRSPVFSGTISVLQNNDTITASYSSSATTNSPVATYPIVPSLEDPSDRKSTRLNSSHTVMSYAVSCLKQRQVENQSRGYGQPNQVF